jgi:hypothetical protein
VHVRFKNKTEFACVDVFKKDALGGVGLPGWLITVNPAFPGPAATPQSDVTDGTGHVRFEGLEPGHYIINETMQPGWRNITNKSIPIFLPASGSCEAVTFINCQENSPFCITSQPVNPFPGPLDPPANQPELPVSQPAPTSEPAAPVPGPLPPVQGLPPNSVNCRDVYIVQRGNTLYSIAFRYNVSVSAIMQANGLWGDTIFVGQRLCIP